MFSLQPLGYDELRITEPQMKDLAQLKQTILSFQTTQTDDNDRQRSQPMDTSESLREKLRESESELSGMNDQTEKRSTADDVLRSSLHELQSINKRLIDDKINFNNIVTRLEKENSAIMAERNSMLQTISGLKNELIRLETTRIDAEKEKSAVIEKFRQSERQRQSLMHNDDLAAVISERNQLNARTGSLEQERDLVRHQLEIAHDDLHSQSEVIVQLKNDKDQMMRSHAELRAKLQSSDGDRIRLMETLDHVQQDGHRLEEQLEETRRRTTELETRNRQIEEVFNDSKDKEKHLQAEVVRLRCELSEAIDETEQQKKTNLDQTETNLQTTTPLLRQQLQETVYEEEHIERRLKHDKELQRIEFEAIVASQQRKHDEETEEIKGRLLGEQMNIETELETVRVQLKEQLNEAETLRQEIIGDAEKERLLLMSKLTRCQDELKTRLEEMEKLKAEFQADKETDRTVISEHQRELSQLRTTHEETLVVNERSIVETRIQLMEANRLQKDSMMREVAEMKVQLKMVEETRDVLRTDMNQVRRKLRQADDEKERLNEDVAQLQQLISKEVAEKEQLKRSTAELRSQMARLEGEKLELNRILDEVRQKTSMLEDKRIRLQKELNEFRSSLHGVEQVRMEAKKEVQELYQVIKTMEGNHETQLENMDNENQKWKQAHNESKMENIQLKNMLVDAENRSESVTIDLMKMERYMNSLKTANQQLREDQKDLAAAAAERRRRELDLEKHCRSLELTIDSANADISDLQIKASASEGRVRVLEGRVAQQEEAKKLAEFKLCSVVSSVKRTVGLRRRSAKEAKQQDEDEDDSSEAADAEQKMLSRSRRRRKQRSSAENPIQEITAAADVDPEDIHNTLHHFSEELNCAERQRDELAASMSVVNVRLNEAEKELNQNRKELEQMKARLAAFHEDVHKTMLF